MVSSKAPRPVVGDPAVMGGTPVFSGTRVPALTLLDYLVAGAGLDVFLDQYPSVSRQQALAALELMREALLAAS